MNIMYKKASAVVFSVIITTSAYGIENENITDVATKPAVSPAWYKKGSVQAAAVVATLAVVGYVVAIRTGRVMIPAYMTALVTEDPVQNNEGTTNLENGNDAQVVVEEAVDTPESFDVNKLAEKFVAEVAKVVSSEKQMKKFFKNYN